MDIRPKYSLKGSICSINNLNGKVNTGAAIDTLIPSQVIFPNGAVTNYEIGNVELVNGKAVLIPPNGTLEDFFSVFINEQKPVVVQPSVSLAVFGDGSYEIGSKVAPSYEVSLDPGSYSYGPDTDVAIMRCDVGDSFSNVCEGAINHFPEIQITDHLVYEVTATVAHSSGAIPFTNNGNESIEEQIKEGIKIVKSSIDILAYRNVFYGTLSEKINNFTSDVIRSLTPINKPLSKGDGFEMVNPVGSYRIIIAYPTNLGDLTSVIESSFMDIEIIDSFSKQTIAVEGANGYNAIDYNVYIMKTAIPNDMEKTLKVTI